MRFYHQTALNNALSIIRQQEYYCFGGMESDYVLNGYEIHKPLSSNPENNGVIIEFEWDGDVVRGNVAKESNILYINDWRTMIRPPYHGNKLKIVNIYIKDSNQLKEFELPRKIKLGIFLKSLFSKRSRQRIEDKFKIFYIKSLHNFDKGINITIPDYMKKYTN